MKDSEFCRHILGVVAPWDVSRVACDPEHKRIDVWIKSQQGESWFGLRRTLECATCGRVFNLRQALQEHTWQHISIGTFKVFVHAELPADPDCADKPGCCLSQPWLGARAGALSEALEQQIGQLLRLRLPEAEIARLTGVDTGEVQRLRSQRRGASDAASVMERAGEDDADDIPPRQHPIWARLLSGEMDAQIKTLSLKLLLSRIRAQARPDDGAARLADIDNLRRYFLKHRHSLRSEMVRIFH